MAATIIGDSIQVNFSFTLLGTTTLADPTEVIVIHRDRSLEEVVYTYLTDGELIRVGEGQYRLTIRITSDGTHVFRPLGSGNVNKAQEITLAVPESYFSDPLPS